MRAAPRVGALQRQQRGAHEQQEGDHRRHRVARQPEAGSRGRPTAPNHVGLPGFSATRQKRSSHAQVGERPLDVIVGADRHAARHAHHVGRLQRPPQRGAVPSAVSGHVLGQDDPGRRQPAPAPPARGRWSCRCRPAAAASRAGSARRRWSAAPPAAPARRARSTRPMLASTPSAAGPSTVPAARSALARADVLAGAADVGAGLALGDPDHAVASPRPAPPAPPRRCPRAPRRRWRSAPRCPAPPRPANGWPARDSPVIAQLARGAGGHREAVHGRAGERRHLHGAGHGLGQDAAPRLGQRHVLGAKGGGTASSTMLAGGLDGQRARPRPHPLSNGARPEPFRSVAHRTIAPGTPAESKCLSPTV